ncbi:MAG: threonine synthase [Bacteroidales bacterium]
MKYYSTNKRAPEVSLSEAVIKGLAPDRGLYMPRKIPTIPSKLIKNMKNQSFQEIACTVANAFFSEDIPKAELDKIVKDTLNFPTPIVEVERNIFSLELFHGPTLAFKDVGGRFMARLLSYFIKADNESNEVNVLVATSGDTGSAVANGFLDVPGIHVYVLYPKGKVSPIQESQFTTLGRNITAIEVDGVFDDCQALVKQAFMDDELNAHMKLTSANSINIARFLPQSFYYFNAYAQLARLGKEKDIIVSVPSGNFGNITAGLFAWWMGLPVKHFIAANNSNDVFYNYLDTGIYIPKASVPTIANAMDVGNPSNFDRIIDLFKRCAGNTHKNICNRVSGFRYSNEQIADTMKALYKTSGYILDPHGACGYQALKDFHAKRSDENDGVGLFLETAHPAKFKSTVDNILNSDIIIPEKLKAFMKGKKNVIPMPNNYDDFKSYLMSNQ